MVSQKTIKAYDFKTIEEYFDYIIESKINGQHAQVKSLITALSKEQKKEFIIHLEFSYSNSKDIEYCKDLTIELL